MHDVLRDSFVTCIRKALYKAIAQRRGGTQDWAYITGRKSRNERGRQITLSRHARQELQRTVDHLNTEEMENELRDLGLYPPPDSVDDMIEWVQGAKTDRVMKADEFRLFQKHKELILRYLARIL